MKTSILTLFVFSLSFIQLHGQCQIDSVFINSILANPIGINYQVDSDGDGIVSEHDEYIEICNEGSQEVNLIGWSLWDDDNINPIYIFGDPLILYPDSCLVIISWWQNTVVSPPLDVLDLIRKQPWIDNDGDLVSIHDKAGNECSVSFGIQDCDPVFPAPCDYWGIPEDGCSLVKGFVECDYLAMALPVEYLYFNVEAREQIIFLEWATGVEINNDYFVVEWSIDGRSFSEIGLIEGQGNSDNQNLYSFSHETPEIGVNYYRLKQVDYNGNFEYSSLRKAELGMESSYSVYPTAFVDNIQIDVNFSGLYSLQVFSLDGKMYTNEEGLKDNQQINLQSLSSGIYLLKLNHNGIIETVRIIRE